MTARAGWYERHILPRLLCCACSAPSITGLRERIAPQASGRVLELGAGGGLNFAFYDPARVEEVVGIDPSPELRLRAEHAPRPAGLKLRLLAGEAEALPFDNASFDSVVCTFTLCSVHNPARVLSEAKRVLRPGGRFLFAEHGLAPDPGVARWQARLDPLWSRLVGGCHLTRDLRREFEQSGLALGDVDRGYLPGVPRFAGWSESGWASV